MLVPTPPGYRCRMRPLWICELTSHQWSAPGWRKYSHIRAGFRERPAASRHADERRAAECPGDECSDCCGVAIRN